MHGGQAIGKRNTEGERVLEFAFANELVVGNTWFKKKPEHLVTVNTLTFYSSVMKIFSYCQMVQV